MNITPAMLRTFPVLKALPEEVLLQLAQQSSARKYSRRGIVLNAGEQEDAVCFLFEGRLQGVDFTIDGREVGLYFVEPGDFCGELALFDGSPQPEYVIALTAVVVVAIPRKLLQEVIFATPRAMQLIAARVASRVRQLSKQRALLGLPNIAQRVCCQLWLLVADKVKEDQPSAIISNPPTHMEIAIMLNLSRETVTRVFQTLQQGQIVKRDGPARLVIKNLAMLRQLADGSQELR
ncbi:MAG: Crp/Fnr family transcriptional regulator [Pseudomonadales bacterium]|nr:Crp/Fnr family transcriptional regulator [Pseudomonadales bacterium]